MKLLRSLFDKLEPLFGKDGKYKGMYPVYEVIDTFFYNTNEKTEDECHLRDGSDLKRMMTAVLVALIPCVVMAMYNTGLQAQLAMQDMGISEVPGWRGTVLSQFNTWIGATYDSTSIASCMVHGALYFLPVYIVTMVVGIAWEMLFAVVRKHTLSEGFFVTGLLLPLTLPPMIPLWQVAIGTSFGVVVGKEIFGGTGRNFLNPALTARAFLFFAYAGDISGNSVWTAVDGFSGATALGTAATDGLKGITDQMTWNDAFMGNIQGSMGETSTLACLIGATLLLFFGVASWRIMSSMLVGGAALSWLFYAVGSESNVMYQIPPHWHLVLGGFAFGMVFMATDPVSGAMSHLGQYIYGFLIGVVCIVIRVINPAFPEGVMLAILFGNVMAPLIDYYVVQANIKRRMLRDG